MQKRLIHHLLLLMALIFGSGAAASPIAEPQAHGVLMTHYLHLLQPKSFEQVGLVGLGLVGLTWVNSRSSLHLFVSKSFKQVGVVEIGKSFKQVGVVEIG